MSRFIAFYLPQFHPIPENDEWWGRGFTEWTNVAKATPLFRGHVQPRIPADLGFYDLRLPDIREQQVQLAKEAGIEGFCYYHYWFGNGRQLLERPFNEVVDSGKPDFPFCLCWANHSWGSSTWTNTTKKTSKTLFVEQQYLGEKDNEQHFYSLIKAFQDKRYIRVDGKPMFVIYDPFHFDNVRSFLAQWRELAKKNHIEDFHFVGIVNPSSYKSFRKDGEDATSRINEILDLGFDAVSTDGKFRAQLLAKGKIKAAYHVLLSRKLGVTRPNVFKQSDINKYLFTDNDSRENVYPTILPNWDRTPRCKSDSIYIDSTPQVFEECARKVLEIISTKSDEHQVVFIKSWNEWGEGNYMEPDMQYGKGYIEALSRAIHSLNEI